MIHHLYQTSHRQGLKVWRVDLQLKAFVSFHRFSSTLTGGGSLLTLEVQSFPPPTLCWWQDFNNYSVFRLHCAGGPVRSSSSVLLKTIYKSRCTGLPLALLIFWNCKHRKERKDGGIKNCYDCCDHILHFYRALSLVSPRLSQPCTMGI
jgi:hypothetical protein